MGKGAHPAVAEGLGGKNISGIDDPKAQIDAAITGHGNESRPQSTLLVMHAISILEGKCLRLLSHVFNMLTENLN